MNNKYEDAIYVLLELAKSGHNKDYKMLLPYWTTDGHHIKEHYMSLGEAEFIIEELLQNEMLGVEE